MSQFTASPEELAVAGQSVHNSADHLDDRVKALKSRVESLFEGGWQGPAAQSFRHDWELWLDGARRVIGGLDQASALLAYTGQTYGSHDDANASAITATLNISPGHADD